MNFKAHLFIAFILSSIYIWYFHLYDSFSFLIQALIVITIASMLPDLDHNNGTMQNWGIGLGLLAAGFGYFYNRIVLGVGLGVAAAIFLISRIAKHRGFLHSIICMGMLALLIFVGRGNSELLWIFIISFWSHLLLDKIPFKLT